MMTTCDNDSNDPVILEPVAVPRIILEKLLQHAATAAHLVGHLDDDAHDDLVGQLGDHVDAVVHGLTEILGGPRAHPAQTAAAPRGGLPCDGAPILASGAGGAR